MIQIIISHPRPQWGREDIVKNGTDSKGGRLMCETRWNGFSGASDDWARKSSSPKSRYEPGDHKYCCHNCKAFWTLEPQGHYTGEEKETVLRAYQVRVSMCGITRIFGIARKRWFNDSRMRLPR